MEKELIRLSEKSGGKNSIADGARIIGVNKNTAYEWIKNDRNINNDALVKIAEHGGDIVFILTGKKSQPTHVDGLTKQQQVVLALLIKALNRCAQKTELISKSIKRVLSDQELAEQLAALFMEEVGEAPGSGQKATHLDPDLLQILSLMIQ